MRLLYITQKGEAFLETLKQKAKKFDDEVHSLSFPETTKERTRISKKMQSRWQKFGKHLSLLYELSKSPQTREYFHWHEPTEQHEHYKPLQAGYIRIHNQSREHLINDLITNGFVEER